MVPSDEQIRAVLKAEIQNDPGGFGYAGVVEDAGLNEDEKNVAIAGMLNAKAADASDVKRRVLRERVLGREVVGAVVYGEYASLTATQRDLLQMIVTCGEIDPGDASIRTLFQGLFGAGTETRANLLALRYRSGSRGEFLLGADFVVQYYHVGQARAV